MHGRAHPQVRDMVSSLRLDVDARRRKALSSVKIF